MSYGFEEHSFYIPYTQPLIDKADVLSSQDSEYKDLVIGNLRPEIEGALGIKLEEYIRRIQTSVKQDVVLDAICKLATVDILLGSGTVEYSEAFKHASKGCEMYGVSLFSDVLDADNEMAVNYIFDNFFSRAFRTVHNYAESGNENVSGGTQLVQL